MLYREPTTTAYSLYPNPTDHSTRNPDINDVEVTEKLRQRFFSKVDKTSTCWNWTGAKCRGYGQFQIQKPRRAPRKAHAVSLLIAGVAIDPNKVIDHICRNTLCVNPAHLRQVSCRTNSIENSISPAAKNVSKDRCLRGHSFDAANTYFFGPNKRYRCCRTCRRDHIRRYRKEGRYQ